MKFLFIYSKKDLASQNIANHLKEYFNDIYEVDKELLEVNKEDLDKADFYIFLSKHRSEKNLPSFTVHIPGILDKEVCPADGVLNSLILINLNKYNTLNYNVSFEVVHHTPTDLDKPTCFVEIGSSEKEWTNKKAGEIVAKAIYNAIEDFKNKNYRKLDVVIGFGGGHYAPKFTRYCLEGKYYFSYLIPKYAKLTDDNLNHLINKSYFDKVLIDWKGLRGEDKKRYIKFFEDNGILWEKI